MKVANRLVINWAASFLSVVLLLSIAAAPALALVAANSVNSSSVIDRSIKTRDIKRNAINSSRIRNYSIRKEDIHSGSINKYKLTSSSVNTYKIQDGSILNRDISGSAAISDSKISYSTKTGHLTISALMVSPYIMFGSSDSRNGDGFGNIWATGPASQYFAAPVRLPEGAVVVNFSARLFDNSPTYRAKAVLWRQDSESSITDMATAETTFGGTSVSWQTKTAPSISSSTIDNSKAYFLLLYLDGRAGDATQFSYAEITYEYTTPGG